MIDYHQPATGFDLFLMAVVFLMVTNAGVLVAALAMSCFGWGFCWGWRACQRHKGDL